MFVVHILLWSGTRKYFLALLFYLVTANLQAQKSETANHLSLIIQATINQAMSDETETILLYFYRYIQAYSAVVY